MRRQPRRTGQRGCGLQRLLRRGNHVHRMAGKTRVAGFGRLQAAGLQCGANGRGHIDAIARQNGQRIGAGGRVRHGGAAGDHRRVVARHVADRERDHARRRAGRRQAPALDAREVLAHAVHLANVRAAVEQGAVDALLVFQRHPVTRQGQQGRAPARDQAQHQVVLRQPLGQVQNALRRRQPGRIGHGVRGLHHLDALGHAHRPGRHMPVAGDHQARQGRVLRPQGLQCLGHGAPRLARAQYQGAASALAAGRLGQPLAHAVQGLCAVHGGIKQRLQKGAGVGAVVRQRGAGWLGFWVHAAHCAAAGRVTRM